MIMWSGGAVFATVINQSIVELSPFFLQNFVRLVVLFRVHIDGETVEVVKDKADGPPAQPDEEDAYRRTMSYLESRAS